MPHIFENVQGLTIEQCLVIGTGEYSFSSKKLLYCPVCSRNQIECHTNAVYETYTHEINLKKTHLQQGMDGYIKNVFIMYHLRANTKLIEHFYTAEDGCIEKAILLHIPKYQMVLEMQ